MSLIVWLPLNGDLRNQGCTDYTITAFEASPTFTTGKIGQCYQRANTSSQITNGLQIQDNLVSTFGTAASVAVWVKPLGTHTHYNGTILSSGDWNKKRWAFGVSQDNSQVDVLCGGYNNYISCPVPVNQWTHLVSTFENGVCKLYKNGVYVGEKSGQAAFDSDANWTGICRETYAGGYFGFNGCINDLRIYDHCLSAAEVREISQGLVLHYKLSDIVFPNYLVNSNFWNGTSNWYGVNGSTITTTTINNIKVGTGTKGTSNNIIGQTATYEYTANTTIDITVSARVYVEETGTFGVGNWITTTQVSGWQGISGTRTYNNNQLIAGWHTITSTLKNATNQYTGKIVTAFSFTGTTFYITNVKLEINSVATAWCMSSSENITNLNTVPDSSGYNHNGTINGTLTLSNDTPRYSINTQFPGTAYIKITSPSTEIKTVSLWAKWNSIPSGQSIIYVDQKSKTGLGLASNGILVNTNQSGNTFNKSNLVANTWYHFVIVSPNGSSNASRKLYINGVEQTALSSTNSWSYTIDELQLGKRSTSSDGFNGKISDFRMYCTALDADAIRQLYEVGAKVDNKNNVHSFELNENNQNEITKTGILKCSTFSEFNGMSFLKYDPNVYIEPDGSCWVRVFHHNNPGAGSFSSGNDFAHSVYIDENRWFNVELANYLDKWEIMVKGKFTATSDEWKLRWIQQYNPMTATYANVAVANITKITTSGYSSSPAAWGGLYFKNGSTYLCANNGTNGNWWGAVGSYSVYQGGIPGWGPSGTITTTGFNDVYLRIDNVTFTTPTAKNTKNKIWTGSEFIEL